VRRPVRSVHLAHLAVAILIVGALCAGGLAGCGPDPDLNTAETSVRIVDNQFAGRTVRIDLGATVVWRNDGRNTHDVVADDKAFHSPTLQPGQVFRHRFTKPGVYRYYCSFHGAPGKGQWGTVVVGDGGKGQLPRSDQRAARGGHTGGSQTIRVPADHRTIQQAVDAATPGDLVTISPGVYHEAVTVTTDRLTIRGLDRNTTIVDGDLRRQNGFKVVAANGVAIENITARGFVGNGFYWTGVTGYRGSYLTAYRNGDYGLYAFDSRRGQFDHSYASGQPDSGFYIGQCQPCDAVIDGVTSEHNELGYSGTNAGGNLFIVHSVFRQNRAGIVPNTLDSEKLAPQDDIVIAGNVVTDNNDANAPRAETAEFDAVFGSGIVIVGGINDTVTKNRVTGHQAVGIGIAPNPGIDKKYWPALRNRVVGNLVSGSGLADLAVLLGKPDDGNCFAGNRFATSSPSAIERLRPCRGSGSGDPNAGAFDLARFLNAKHPEGAPWQKSPVPRREAQMPGAASAPAHAATDVPIAVNLATVRIPGPGSG